MTDLTPPFSLIKEIRMENSQSKAYDGDGGYLFELTFEGALLLLLDYPEINSKGFSDVILATLQATRTLSETTQNTIKESMITPMRFFGRAAQALALKIEETEKFSSVNLLSSVV